MKVKELEGRGGGTRMYYDLNIPYAAENHGELKQTLAFLAECQSHPALRKFLADTDLRKWATILLR